MNADNNSQETRDNPLPEKRLFRRRLIVEGWRYTVLIGMGGLVALLSSYLLRQFGY